MMQPGLSEKGSFLGQGVSGVSVFLPHWPGKEVVCVAMLAGHGREGNGGFPLNGFSHSLLGVRTLGTHRRGAEFRITGRPRTTGNMNVSWKGDLRGFMGVNWLFSNLLVP